MKKYVFGAVLLAISSSALAVTETRKTIGAIYATRTATTFTLVGATTTGTCAYTLLQIRNTSFTTDATTYQTWYSGLMAALRAGSPVTVNYTNTSGTCVVDQIDFL
jgi:hypothetical protein